MKFNCRSSGETRHFYKFVGHLSVMMANLYDENDNEEYRQALKDVGFELCKYLEPLGIPLNRTPLTADWLDSEVRKEYRKGGRIE